MEPENPLLDTYILNQEGKKNQKSAWLCSAGWIVGALTFVLSIIQYLIQNFILGFLIFGVFAFLLQFWNIFWALPFCECEDPLILSDK